MGVLRTLRIGTTLCRDDTTGTAGAGKWQLCLSDPEAHKTSKVSCLEELAHAARTPHARPPLMSYTLLQIFGCSKTALNAACAAWVDRYLALACVPEGGYVFPAAGDDPTAPLSPQDWTRLVQHAYATHSEGGVALCPKDLRASYITFLRSSAVEDDLVRETALAMRHSSATAAVRPHPVYRTLCRGRQRAPTGFPAHLRLPVVSTSAPQSAAYDKNGTQPLVDRAMQATAAFSAQFVA